MDNDQGRHHTPGLLRRFVSDRSGRVVIAQPPNAPLIGWAATGLAAVLLPAGALQGVLSFFSGAFAFVWAWLEVTRGDSPLRRTFGVLAIAALLAWRWWIA